LRTLLALLLLASALTVTPLHAQTRDDSLGIRKAAADYIEGWYAGDADRMARALHPELVKRILLRDRAGNAWIGDMGATDLIRRTRIGGGTDTPNAERGTDVRILDIFQDAASARIDAGGWIDYLHLVRWRGQWVILNVLWENRRPPGTPG
jgi:hypothetical protein